MAPVVDAFSSFGVGGSAQDDNGHGTHVAGIIAARNNSVGVVGVAPEAKIYAVKVLDASGSGSDASVIKGLDYVAANSEKVTPYIRVVNQFLSHMGQKLVVRRGLRDHRFSRLTSQARGGIRKSEPQTC